MKILFRIFPLCAIFSIWCGLAIAQSDPSSPENSSAPEDTPSDDTMRLPDRAHESIVETNDGSFYNKIDFYFSDDIGPESVESANEAFESLGSGGFVITPSESGGGGGGGGGSGGSTGGGKGGKSGGQRAGSRGPGESGSDGHDSNQDPLGPEGEIGAGQNIDFSELDLSIDLSFTNDLALPGDEALELSDEMQAMLQALQRPAITAVDIFGGQLLFHKFGAYDGKLLSRAPPKLMGLSPIFFGDSPQGPFVEGREPGAETEFALGLLPFVGSGQDLYQAATGRTLLTAEELGTFERVASLTFGVVGIIPGGGAAAKAVSKGGIVLTKQALSKLRFSPKVISKGAKAIERELVVDFGPKGGILLFPEESLESLGHLRPHALVDAAKVNEKMRVDRGLFSPGYSLGTSVTHGVLRAPLRMYRVWGGKSGMKGSFLIPFDPRLAPKSVIRQAFAIPESNTLEFITPVDLPAGTELRMGQAAGSDIFDATGGSLQVELLEQIESGWGKTEKWLDEFGE